MPPPHVSHSFPGRATQLTHLTLYLRRWGKLHYRYLYMPSTRVLHSYLRLIYNVDSNTFMVVVNQRVTKKVSVSDSEGPMRLFVGDIFGMGQQVSIEETFRLDVGLERVKGETQVNNLKHESFIFKVASVLKGI